MKKDILVIITIGLAACLHIINLERNYKLPEEPRIFHYQNYIIEEEVIEKEKVIENFKNHERRIISAYNAGDINQCSGNPCVSANGENVCKLLEEGERVCAANFVPFNTIINIEGYGDCRIIDRLNKKYKDRVDIAMKLNEKKEALDFGIKELLIKY